QVHPQIHPGPSAQRPRRHQTSPARPIARPRPNCEAKKSVLSIQTELGELYLPLEGLVDVAAEVTRLTRELEKIAVDIGRAQQQLTNPNFVQRAPPEVLAEHRKRLEDLLARQQHAQKALAGLKD